MFFSCNALVFSFCTHHLFRNKTLPKPRHVFVPSRVGHVARDCPNKGKTGFREMCAKPQIFLFRKFLPHRNGPQDIQKKRRFKRKGGRRNLPAGFFGVDQIWVMSRWSWSWKGDALFFVRIFFLPSMFLLGFFQISRVFSSFFWDLPRTKLKGLIKDVPMIFLEISGDVLDKLFWESWSEVADDYSMCWIRALWKPMIMIMIEISVPCLGWIYDGFLPFTTYHPLQTSSNLLGIVQVSTFKDGFWSGGEAYPIHWQV